MTEPRRHAQAFVELRAEDPEATSALGVARERLAAGRTLASLRRLRVFELAGPLPGPAEIAERLHGSTQFYNPARERCMVRAGAADGTPFGADETLVLVLERGGERRPAAERWWRHETGEKVEVREGIVWAMRFAPGGDAAALGSELAVTRDRAHGLLANPHFQDARVWPGPPPPLDWLSHKAPRAPKRARRTS